MTSEVQIQYEEMERIAGQFASQADAIGQMMRNINAKMEDLRPDWIGRGSEAFFNEMEGEVLPAVNRLCDALLMGDQVSKQIVQTLEAAENDASHRFVVLGG